METTTTESQPTATCEDLQTMIIALFCQFQTDGADALKVMAFISAWVVYYGTTEALSDKVITQDIPSMIRYAYRCIQLSMMAPQRPN